MNMQDTGRTYIAIDLKSFYASVECVERGLEPAHDQSRRGRQEPDGKDHLPCRQSFAKSIRHSQPARLFEVEQKLREVNAERRSKSYGYRLTGKSVSDIELKTHPDWEVDYITATPRMAYYIEHSTRIYKIYLNYIAPEDIHVYSIDEVFMDVTDYLSTYGVTAHELARRMIGDVLRRLASRQPQGLAPICTSAK